MNFKPGGSMDPTIPLWINGEEVHSKLSEPISSPSTSEILYRYASASVDDCLKAVEVAQEAFKSWSKTTISYRRDILLRAADILRTDPDITREWTDAWVSETGEIANPHFHALAASMTAEMIIDTAGRIAGAMCGFSPLPLDASRTAIISKEPFGVCFACSPWNVPQVLGVRSVLFAIATGNTVVLKGSEMSPKCYWQIGKLFKDAGLPDGVLNVIYSRRQDSAETVRQIIEHPAVKHVNFTGSTNVGRIFASLAGKSLKPCILELGGKAPSIVLQDADLDNAASQCAAGAILHSGQICMATERVLVHESIVEDFVQRLSKVIEAMSAGNPSTMSSAGGADRTRQLVADAVSQGAEVLHGSVEEPTIPGARVHPVVLKGVKKGMDLHYTESFGPQVSVYTFKDDAEALEIANDTGYGLVAAIFSKDLNRALALAKEIESGAVHINTLTVFNDPSFPHGGAKDSGYGRFNAQFGLDGFLRLKTISWVA